MPNTVQIIVFIIAIALGTMVTRFVPFILFPEHKEPPKVVMYLSRVLPPAMIGLLVVYCLKSVTFLSSPYGIPELVSVGVIVVLHKWRHNALLSIVAGTVCYMVMVQSVFG